MGTLRLVLCTLWWCVQEIKRKNLSSVSYCVLWIVSFWQCFECVKPISISLCYFSNPSNPTKSLENNFWFVDFKSAVPLVVWKSAVCSYLVNSADFVLSIHLVYIFYPVKVLSVWNLKFIKSYFLFCVVAFAFSLFEPILHSH